MKLISILTPTHNRGKSYLIQTIQSVAKQVENGFTHEHIIVDNKSTDNTRKIIQALSKTDKRIKYIYNPRNLGAADALNIAFKKSKGDLIIPLDDDDILPPQSLQSRFTFFLNNPKADWTYGHLVYIDENNVILPGPQEMDVRRSKIKNLVYSILHKNFIPNGTMTIRRAAIKKVGGWDNNLKTQDFDLSLRLAAAGFIPLEIPDCLCLYRKHTKQSHKKQIRSGIYITERLFYLNKYNITEAALKNLAE